MAKEKPAPTMTLTPEKIQQLRDDLAANGTLPAKIIKEVIDQYEHLNVVVTLYSHEPVIVRQKLWDLQKLSAMYQDLLAALVSKYGTIRIEEKHFIRNKFTVDIQKDKEAREYVIKKRKE